MWTFFVKCPAVVVLTLVAAYFAAVAFLLLLFSINPREED